MKYIILIGLFISGFCCAQNLYYLLPEGNSFYLYEKQENDLVQLEKLDFDYTELYAFDGEELVIVNNDSTKIHYGKIENNRFVEEVVEEFPKKFKVQTIELKDQFAYLGGIDLSNEFFYVFDIESKEFFSVPIPEEVKVIGKAIDDVLFLDKRMIAVDNIIFPKFLIEYDLKELPNLRSSKVTQLKYNGTYEQYKKGEINKDYLILLSDTHSVYIGTSYHISVLRSSDFDQGFSVSSKLKKSRNEYFTWNDILLVNNKVFVACKEKGLGVFEIMESYFKKEKHPKLNDVWLNNKISQKKIQYIEAFDREPIKILSFSSDKIIVILNNPKNQKSFKLIEI